MSVVRDASGAKVEETSTKVEGEGQKFPLFHMRVLKNVPFVSLMNERVGKTPKSRRKSQ